MYYRRRRFLESKKNKPVLKVVFLAIHKSIWKVDPVFKKMLDDDFFDPVILVCPYVTYGKERMFEELKLAYEYFSSKGYPVLSSYNKEDESWVQIEDLKPDLVFFTNPHNLTRSDYYDQVFKKYLSLYVPYYFMATKHAGDAYSMYASQFLNAAFKIFWPSEYHLKKQNSIINRFFHNGVVSGYPSVESLITGSHKNSVWKTQKKLKKKIIFAAHHSIEGAEKSLSSFLNFAEVIRLLAVRFSDQVQWSFKPHPVLKAKLCEQEGWGKERVEKYFEFWAESDFTQLDEGDYVDLFLQSDAIIHDCSSFISEYVFTGNPGLYLMEPEKADRVVNEFGKMFLSQYVVSDKPSEVEDFIVNVITDNVTQLENQELRKYIMQYYVENSPSELIIRELKSSLFVKNP